jgi:hypothetical protein
MQLELNTRQTKIKWQCRDPRRELCYHHNAIASPAAIASDQDQDGAKPRAAAFAEAEVAVALGLVEPDAEVEPLEEPVVMVLLLVALPAAIVLVVLTPSVPVRVASIAIVMAFRSGVAVPTLSGAGVLGVKSGVLLQFWF